MAIAWKVVKSGRVCAGIPSLLSLQENSAENSAGKKSYCFVVSQLKWCRPLVIMLD